MYGGSYGGPQAQAQKGPPPETIARSASPRRDVAGKPGSLLGQSIDTVAGSVLLTLWFGDLLHARFSCTEVPMEVRRRRRRRDLHQSSTSFACKPLRGRRAQEEMLPESQVVSSDNQSTQWLDSGLAIFCTQGFHVRRFLWRSAGAGAEGTSTSPLPGGRSRDLWVRKRLVTHRGWRLP
jgi:hypothetical protein